MPFIPYQRLIGSEPLPAIRRGQFITGPDVRPYARSSQEPIRLLEEVSPIELASCVPFIKITQIDPRTGKDMQGARPIMLDLVGGPIFGEPQERFSERSLVSLKSVQVKTTLDYGTIVFKEIELSFRVHKPDIVFSRDSGIPWRTLMDEGTSHVLEYGWTADPRVVKNEMFNGVGFVDRATGLVIPSTVSLLLVIWKYDLTLTKSGEVDVVLRGLENGDLALRESRLGDTIPVRSRAMAFAPKQELANGIKRMLDSLPRTVIKKRGEFVLMKDVLDVMIGGPVLAACERFGYSGVDFYAGNFNKKAERSSEQYGGIDLTGRSIGDFMLPLQVLRDAISNEIATGKTVQLMNFIRMVVNLLNAAAAWATPQSDSRLKPNVEVRTTTLRDHSAGTTKLVFFVIDRHDGVNPFTGQDRLDLDKQSKANVFSKLESLNVPILEFGRARSVIVDASFQIQTDPLLQSVQIEQAYKDRKDRVQMTSMPDVEARTGASSPRELIPVSTLEGEISMVGNFVLDSLAALWVEFYGAQQVSGLFRVLEKTDVIEPGRFRSTYKLISDGLDPLNTRLRRTQQEIAEADANAARVRSRR